MISHDTAADLWGIRPRRPRQIELMLAPAGHPRPPGLTVHRRELRWSRDVTHIRGVPVTRPLQVLLDIAVRLDRDQLERAVNEAANRDLIDPEGLHEAIEERHGERGVRPLRELLDREAFVVTDTVLEQRMLRIARRAGLPRPLTQTRVNGYRVDFLWPDLGIVVEADGLRFHRTPAQQAVDGAGTRHTQRLGSCRCASPTGRSSTSPAASRPRLQP